jgi:glutamate synthase (NADPH/NADH) large chain
MVDLDPLSDEDLPSLRQLIYDHYLYTGSTVAKFLLDDFENQQKHFVKVFPKDYKKVLLQREGNLRLKA